MNFSQSTRKETISLQRDVEGLTIPNGHPLWLHAGTSVQLTQSLGTSFTIYTDGHLIRIYGHDADALGKNQPIPFEWPMRTEDLTAEMIVAALRNVYDPEIPVNIVDLGLIYDCNISLRDHGVFVNIVMTLTAPACGMGPILAQDVEKIAKSAPGVADVHIDVVFDPPWSYEMMSDRARIELGLI